MANWNGVDRRQMLRHVLMIPTSFLVVLTTTMISAKPDGAAKNSDPSGEGEMAVLMEAYAVSCSFHEMTYVCPQRLWQLEFMY